MKKYITILAIIMNCILSNAQDTIRLKDTQSAYKTGNGFTYLVDENQHNIGIEKYVKIGLYTLVYNNHCVGQINKLSNKESIIYYFDSDSIVNAIEFRPFFKIRLNRDKETYSIWQIISYQLIKEIDFHLMDKNFYIKFYDKEHRKSIEILNLELINEK